MTQEVSLLEMLTVWGNAFQCVYTSIFGRMRCFEAREGGVGHCVLDCDIGTGVH